MSVTDAVQVAIVTALKADAPLTGMVSGRVLDHLPTDAPHPCISLGPEEWPQTWADCLDGVEGTVQIDIWSREPGRREAKGITDRVAAILHGAELTLAGDYRAVSCEVILRRILRDPDGITTHGVVQVRIEADAV